MARLLSTYIKFFERSWSRDTRLRSSTFLVLLLTYTVAIFLSSSVVNIKDMSKNWVGPGKVQVYLEDNSKKHQDQVGKEIKLLKEVEQIRYISSDESIEQFTESNSVFAKEFIDDIKKEGIFTSSYEITLENSVTDENYINYVGAVSEEIKKIKGVEEVAYGKNWIAKYSSFINFTDLLLTSVVALLIISTIIILSNLIRVLVYNHKSEIEILELVGETYLNIRFPFVMEGIIFSTISFGFALLINSVFMSSLKYELKESLIFIELGQIIEPPSYMFIVIGMTMSIVLGALTAYKVSSNINTGWAFSKGKKV